jgi:hypothetical protein
VEGSIHGWRRQVGGEGHLTRTRHSRRLPPPVLLHSSPRWRSEHTLPTVKIAHHRARTGTLVFVFRPVQPAAPCSRSEVICCCCWASPSSTNVSRKSCMAFRRLFFLVLHSVCVTLTHWKVCPGQINFPENSRNKFHEYKLTGKDDFCSAFQRI